jgi:hypothetical protein
VFLIFAQHLGEAAKSATRDKNLAAILGFQMSLFICKEEEWTPRLFILRHHTAIAITIKACFIFITICIISAFSLLSSTLSPLQ